MDSFFKKFIENQISISYLGVPNDQITHQLTSLAESFIANNETLEKTSAKVSFLIAESFQNIIRHGSKTSNYQELENEKDFFQINFLPHRVIIASKNLVENQRINTLDDKINEINELDKDSLKDTWKKTISEGNFSKEGGAGLGVIEMARKSGMPLRKKFTPLNNNLSQFFLAIELKKPSAHEINFKIEDTENQYNYFINTGIWLEYVGNFSKDSNNFLIDLLHNNLTQTANNSDALENLSIMIEVVQNASKHNGEMNNPKNGFFSIVEKNNERFIYSGNYVQEKDFNTFKNLLENISTKNTFELKEERKKMLDNTISSEGNSGLGLIEIALFSNNTFEYNFTISEHSSIFFSIKIQLR